MEEVALVAVATLSLAEIPTAEAAGTEKEDSILDDTRTIITIAVIVVFAGYGVVEFVKATANVLFIKIKHVVKNDAVSGQSMPGRAMSLATTSSTMTRQRRPRIRR